MSGCFLQHLLTEVVNMKTEKQKTTIELLEIMIQETDKGPSGFWTDDYEGCGNPNIFPEFEEGLKRGKLVQKEHYLCPWNTAIMFGEGHGNIHTGCYHSCSIDKAKYLSSSMLKDVLLRFKSRLIKGEYDCTDNLRQLLTVNEIDYIERQIKIQQQIEDKKRQEQRETRYKKASALIQKYPEYAELFGTYYGEKIIVQTYDGNIDFDPQGYLDIVGANRFTYDEYIDVQIRSFHKTRGWFAICYYNIPLSFKGKIERKTKDNICFKRIMVDGMYSDGICFEGKEEHVWMSITGFEEYDIGDAVSFFAEVYRYVKTSNGKQIDYSLRNPQSIQKIDAYTLPTDEDLKKQAGNDIICETCYLSERCNRATCLLSKETRENMQKQMFDLLKDANESTIY